MGADRAGRGGGSGRAQWMGPARGLHAEGEQKLASAKINKPNILAVDVEKNDAGKRDGVLGEGLSQRKKNPMQIYCKLA